MPSLHRLEISRQALLTNVATFRKIAPASAFMAVVKSNAYGHDLELVVQSLMGEVDWFGVNSLHEAWRIRRLDQATPILVMGLNAQELLPGRGPAITEKFYTESQAGIPDGVHLVVSSLEMLQHIAEHAPHTAFHLKIDTGLSRLGVCGRELNACLEFLEQNPGLHWTGLMTHFANVEDVTDQSYALEQLRQFVEVRERASVAAGDRRLLVHAAASAPALILPAARLDLIRVGISLYGLWPSSETKLSALNAFGELPELRPVLRWLTRVVHVHAVPAGASVGYGCTYQVPADTKVATLAVGYYEGYERALSNRAYVLLHGRRARVLGRVSMNMIVVDVGHLPEVRAGDEAVLLGAADHDSITADQLGELTGTINYEVVTRINSNLPRVIVD